MGRLGWGRVSIQEGDRKPVRGEALGNWLDWPGRTPRPQEKESGTGWRLWQTLCSVTEGVGLADVWLVWVEPRASKGLWPGTDEAGGGGERG